MACDRLTTSTGARGLGRPADHLSFGAALALFAIAAIVWLVTTQPVSVLHLRSFGSDVPLSRGQIAVLISTMYGVLALAAGLFALFVHAVYWPATANRENSRGPRTAPRGSVHPQARAGAALGQARSDACLARRDRHV
jgi:hypothetical protein